MHIIINSIAPLILLITGYLLKFFPPKNINSFIGYRTERSMKNFKTWNEANKYSTRLLINSSWVTLILTISNSIILGNSYVIMEILISIILILISIIIVLLLTEKHLKDAFEK